MEKVVFVSGKNGVGKDAQKSAFLSKEGRTQHYEEVAVGTVLRSEREQKTELGIKAQDYMDRGELLPDELVNEMTVNKIRQSDKIVLLNGFPRTRGQLKYLLEQGIYPEMVIVFEVPEEEIIRRVKSRRICSKCGETYTVTGYRPPKVAGICDKCGSSLTIRKDDNEEIVRKRFEEYKHKTAPVIEDLRNMNIPIHVIDNTTKEAEKEFESLMLSLL